jgi:hypothetical protein
VGSGLVVGPGVGEVPTGGGGLSSGSEDGDDSGCGSGVEGGGSPPLSAPIVEVWNLQSVSEFVS